MTLSPAHALEILWQLGVVEFKVRYVRRSLSYLWWFLEPALLALTFFFLTLVLSGAGRTGLSGFSEIFMRVVLWQWFRNSVQLGMTAMASSAGILKQVRFPPVLLLASKLATELFNCAISLALVLLVLAASGQGPHLSWLQFPLVLGVQFALTLALCLWLSVAAVFVQDTVPVANFVLNLLMYVSPVAFRPEMVPARFRPYLAWNPFTPIMAAYNDTLIDGAGITNWPALALVTAVSAVVAAGGFVVFQRFKRKFYRFL